MPSFDYTARTRAGERVSGRIDASDRAAAVAALARMGHVPVSVAPAGAPAAKAAGKAAAKPAAAAQKTAQKATPAPKKRKSAFRLERGAHMSQHDVGLFTGELADLLDAGMTLGNALSSLVGRDEDETSGRAPVISAIRDAIVGGSSFSDALGLYPKIFTPVYVNMIRAGEASGALTDVLRRLVAHFERTNALRQRMISAMTYPAIVMVMGFAVGIIAVKFILPKFQRIFDSIGSANLPAATRALLGISDWLTQYGLVLLLALAVAAFMGYKYVQTHDGRRRWDRLKLRLPLVRGIVASGLYANFAYTLQSLLQNGVPVLSALRITAQTLNNTVLADELENARERVTDGTTISGPLAAGGVFPPMLIDLLAIGEKTGDMPAALGHVGKRYEAEMNRNVTLFTTALEPMLILVVAVIVGFVAVAIIMAVLSMTNGMQNA